MSGDLPVEGPYASVIPSRTPTSRAYLKRGQALASISSRAHNTRSPDGDLRYGVAEGRVYQHIEGRWELLYDVAAGTPTCDLPWKKGRESA
ncbi:hypothetical protein [Sanguibacter antarcticus]|uniref:Uncharacterized protein n=1 Tax=Sanguibacter antarcticus TaxID=372484 RepID=A0A2A9E7L7_9MICO|nr:hypothetical protein [Sanguibacter antarcticus]PFG34854.1 hypothetical protein ATL42_2782 [Sanguibacter antarcticus]